VSRGLHHAGATLTVDLGAIRANYRLLRGRLGATANPLQPVVRLDGRIVQIREVAAGAAVGYGATCQARGRRRIATVAVGYPDGYRRSLSGRATALAGDVRVPLVGIVSMDTATFDVTGAPVAEEGGFLELIGPGNPVDALGSSIPAHLVGAFALHHGAQNPRVERFPAHGARRWLRDPEDEIAERLAFAMGGRGKAVRDARLSGRVAQRWSTRRGVARPAAQRRARQKAIRSCSRKPWMTAGMNQGLPR
jgi:hypothetical protein